MDLALKHLAQDYSDCAALTYTMWVHNPSAKLRTKGFRVEWLLTVSFRELTLLPFNSIVQDEILKK